MGMGAFMAAKTVLNIPIIAAIKITVNFRFLRIRRYSLRFMSYWAKTVSLTVAVQGFKGLRLSGLKTSDY